MELDGKLSRFVLLSLSHHKGQDVVLLLLSSLLHMWHLLLLPWFMLPSPLLHLWHLVLLSLGQCHLIVLQRTSQARRVMSHLALGMSLWCNS